MLLLQQGCDGRRLVVDLFHVARLHAVCATLWADPNASGTSSISLSMHTICQPVLHASHSSKVSSGFVRCQILHARLASELVSW